MKQGWKIKKIKDICSKASSNIAQNKITELDGDYPVFGASGYVQNIDFYHQNTEYIGIVKDGSGVGRVNKYPAYSSLLGTLQYILPKEGYDLNYVGYALQSLNLAKYASGAAIPHIYFRDYGEETICVPPLAEQERIVAILDREFEKIDALKENAEKNLQHAKDLFQSALKQKLQPKEGWATKTISEISENLDYRRVPVTKKDRSVGVYPYYGASGIVDYVDGFLFDENLLLVSEDGANLLARSTPIAFSVSGKIWVNNHAHILRFPNIELQRYVEYFFAGLDISEYVTGAAQPKFNQKALNSILITYPPKVSEQQELIDHLDKLEENCRTLEENYTKTIALCDDMKQALLRKAFNGKL